jgi:putative flippase GtrA
MTGKEGGQVGMLRGLYARFRQLIHEAARFGVVGVLGLIVTEVGYYLLHNTLTIGPLTSVTIATIAATIVTFLGNRHWTFRHRTGSGTAREGILFFALNGVGLLIQYACIGVTNYGLGLTDKVSNQVAVTVGIGVGTLFRFWSYRKWVWVQAPATTSPPAPPASARPAGFQPEHLEPGLREPLHREPVTVPQFPALPQDTVALPD